MIAQFRLSMDEDMRLYAGSPVSLLVFLYVLDGISIHVSPGSFSSCPLFYEFHVLLSQEIYCRNVLQLRIEGDTFVRFGKVKTAYVIHSEVGWAVVS